MLGTSFSITEYQPSECNSASYKKYYSSNGPLSIISYRMDNNEITNAGSENASLEEINAESFAEWVQDAYRRSTFKSHADLAKAVGALRGCISHNLLRRHAESPQNFLNNFIDR